MNHTRPSADTWTSEPEILQHAHDFFRRFKPQSMVDYDNEQDMGINLTENWAVRAGRQYIVRDMRKHEHVGVAVRNWTVTIGAHDVAALLLTDAEGGPAQKLADGELAPPLRVDSSFAASLKQREVEVQILLSNTKPESQQ
ncbi:hypothetical protein LTS16_026353 [Friedmanniomyces endolithicus]|nr:hypothetical protein LTS01_025097 [Friedmanniomyces endolithicus]KAK1021656.1 hypothetical protein LTS16_026353 [Friedmanniomyces endolithicus]